MGTNSLSQMALIGTLSSLVFMLGGLAIVVFGVIKTRDLPRTLLMVAGVMIVLTPLTPLLLAPLLRGGSPLLFLLPTMLAGVLGLAELVCLVLAVVKASEQRAESPPPGPAYAPHRTPGQNQHYQGG